MKDLFLFSKEDIDQNERIVNTDIERCYYYINKGSRENSWNHGNAHWYLSSSLLDKALVLIARTNYSDALESIDASIRIRIWLYQKHSVGFNIAKDVLGASNWIYLLWSFLLRNDSLSQTFDKYYREYAIKNDTGYQNTFKNTSLGMGISSIFNQDYDKAIEFLQALPLNKNEGFKGLSGRYKGLPECVYALAQQNIELFEKNMQTANKEWVKYIKKHEKGCLFSFCFIFGASLICLAEKVFGYVPFFDNLYIPRELLNVKSYSTDILPDNVLQ
jgi:hypothetical protein